MELFIAILSITCIIFAPVWIYGVATGKAPVSTDDRKLDKLFVIICIMNVFFSAVIKASEYFAP